MIDNEPTLSTAGAALAVAEKTFPKITKEGIAARVADASYVVHDHKVVICILRMVNGFRVTGESAVVDERNFDEAIGKRIAFDRAFAKLWELEAYLLQEMQWRAQMVGTQKPAENTATPVAESVSAR